MTEPLSELLRLRITPSQRQHLSEAAALAGLSSSEYARRLLTSSDSIKTELVALRHAIELLTEHQKTSIEALLLLRGIAPLENIKEAHQRMSTLGYPPVYMED